jgi:hypothetical protein
VCGGWVLDILLSWQSIQIYTNENLKEILGELKKSAIPIGADSDFRFYLPIWATNLISSL